jgi:hypothetical protein
VSTHTVFCLKTPLPAGAQHLLCALFNSFVVDYLVRLRVSTHVTTSIVEQLPVPTLADDSRAQAELIRLARRLRRSPDVEASARLNALVAHAYRLSTEELWHVLSRFPLVVQKERDAVIAAFGALP